MLQLNNTLNAALHRSEKIMTTQAKTTVIFQQGVAALKAGDRHQARTLFTQVLQNEPHHQPALLWLAGAVDAPDERRQYLERVIAINPHNEAGKRAQSGLERLRDADLPAVEQIVVPPCPATSRPPASKRIAGSTQRSRPRWADEMLRVSVGCFGALGLIASFLPQLLTGTLGIFFLAVGCGAGLLHVLGTLKLGGSPARGIMEVLLFNALAFGLIYGCFWYFTVHLASQPLVVFPTIAPTSIPK